MTTPSFAELLAPIARRELSKAYGSPLRPWRPLSIRDRTFFGRKRRARRARGRRIKARPPYSATAIAFAAEKKWQLLLFGQPVELARFIDPSVGEPRTESPHA
jgi:hypothetical protein